MIQVNWYVGALTETCKCPVGSCRFWINSNHFPLRWYYHCLHLLTALFGKYHVNRLLSAKRKFEVIKRP